ncbi:MAG: hypothetical protein GDA47_00280 [Rhodospirillales bacterium]|nr:hypothetical protein [Rhodospirillales bacterium]
MRLPQVTDHAVLRYLERGLGVDVEALRRRIARVLAPVAVPADRAGAPKALISGGLRYRLEAGPDGRLIVVTVRSAQAGPISNRAQRLRRRAARRP